MIFEGTPSEFTALMRACLEDSGVSTESVPESNDPTVYRVANGRLSDSDLYELSMACEAEIGTPKIGGLSEAELIERYEARVDQLRCLTDAGLTDAVAPSLEVFVDDYRRSGESTLWEPTLEVEAAESGGGVLSPTDLCSRAGDTW